MITGGCMCGACRYEAAGDMLWAAYCHCRDCQRATGSAFAMHVIDQHANRPPHAQ